VKTAKSREAQSKKNTPCHWGAGEGVCVPRQEKMFYFIAVARARPKREERAPLNLAFIARLIPHGRDVKLIIYT
jgi:hypothetical protein